MYQSKNLSFRSLSRKCDLDYADLNKIEKGKRNITLITIIELAKGLDIRARELFDFSFPLNNSEKAISSCQFCARTFSLYGFP
nr:helix-turn-helix transcriptional regulator [uncultured Salegentibacter sp.]